jgi:photoactive yellow protein
MGLNPTLLMSLGLSLRSGRSTETALSNIVIETAFETVTLAELQTMQGDVRDQLPFGVIGLDALGIAKIYNKTEAHMAGLDPQRVLGCSFFNNVAQCMNNFLVAQRFEDEPELDAIVPFVLTLRMRPTPVRLRLLASESVPLRFILIER